MRCVVTFFLLPLTACIAAAQVYTDSASNNLTEALFTAVVDKNLEFVKNILTNNSNDVSFLNNNIRHENAFYTNLAYTPLVEACMRGYLEIASELLVTGKANVDAKTNNGFTALYAATDMGHLGIVKLLVETGKADVNMENGPYNDTALMRAANLEMLDIVQYFLDQKAEIGLLSSRGFSALYYATLRGNVEIAEVLVSEGKADVNVLLETNIGKTVLMYAASQGSLDLVKLFIENGNANPNLRSREHGYTAVYLAIQQGHANVTKYLVKEASANVYIRSKEGCTSLYAAAENGQTDVINYLLHEIGVDGEEKSCNNLKSTPLQIASENGHHSTVKQLLTSGATAAIDYKNLKNETALYLAALKGHVALLRLLVEYGAKVDLTNTVDDLTALHTASSQGHYEAVQFLVEEAGASVLAQTASRESPMAMARINSHIRIVNYLERKEGCGRNTITEKQNVKRSSQNFRNRGSWPWLASLGRFEKGTWQHMCTGSLITDEHVLTAAHCIDPELKMIRIGDGALNETVGIQWRFIREVKMHPKYEPPLFDVAVIVLSSPANFTDGYAGNICLPNVPTNSSEDHVGDQMDVVGWGLSSSSTRSQSNNLNLVQQKILSNSSLRSVEDDSGKRGQVRKPSPFPLDAICSGYEFENYCFRQEDSGGPLMHYAYFDSPSTAQYVQEGIIQRNPQCTSKGRGGFLSVHSRLRHPETLAFIKESLQESERRKTEDLTYELHEAISRDDVDGVRALLLQFNDTSDRARFVNHPAAMPNHENRTVEAPALHRACLEGRIRIVNVLVTLGGADVNQRSSEDLPAIHYAIARSRQDVILFLLKREELDVDAPYGPDGTTVLIEATRRNMNAVVDTVLSRGRGDVDLRSTSGKNALYHAAELENTEIAKLLVLKGGADVNARTTTGEGWTPVIVAAAFGNLPMLKFLVEEGGGKVNIKSKVSGYPPLILATGMGHTEIVLYLLQSTNADPNIRENTNITSLAMACFHGYLDIVELLVEEAGLDVNELFLMAKSGTPLMLASFKGHDSVVRYLLRKGAKVDMLNRDRKTALCLATKNGHLGIVKVLVELGGADINAKCRKEGWTALHIASKNGFLDIVKYLVEEVPSVDPQIRTGDGNRTASELAKEYQQEETARYLLEHGDDD